jgi:hypothetical protein
LFPFRHRQVGLDYFVAQIVFHSCGHFAWAADDQRLAASPAAKYAISRPFGIIATTKPATFGLALQENALRACHYTTISIGMMVVKDFCMLYQLYPAYSLFFSLSKHNAGLYVMQYDFRE